MTDLLDKLDAFYAQSKMRPITDTIPLEQGGVFYTSEPLVEVRTYQIWLLFILLACVLIVPAMCVYNLIVFGTWEGLQEKEIFIGLVCMIAVPFFIQKIYRRLRNPVTATVYDHGIWITDYKLYIPHERVFSVELGYENTRRLYRFPSIVVYAPDRRNELVKKNLTLRFLNSDIHDDLIKIDFGIHETMVEGNAEKIMTRIHSSVTDFCIAHDRPASILFFETKSRILEKLRASLPI